MHGKTSPILHSNTGVFTGLANPFEATRYHSLVIKPGTVPPDFEVTAPPPKMKSWASNTNPRSVQFHPESFLTLEGPKLFCSLIS